MKRALALVAVALLAACSGDDGASTATTTTEQATTPVVVRVQADHVMSCGQSPVVTGSELVVTDDHDTKVATATFELTGESCDWIARASVPTGSDLYTLESNGEELATVDLEAKNWAVTLHVDINGRVTVV